MNATQEKTLVKPEILDELIVFLADDNLDNVDCPDDAIVQNDFNNHLTAIMASLGDKQPSHTVLHTLIFCALASSLEHTGGKLFLGEIISPEQQTPEQKQFVDVVAGHIGNQITNILQEKIENRDTAVSRAILKVREAFIEDPEVIGLVNLLGKLEHYVSKDGISALRKALDDFDQFRTDTLEAAADLLPLVYDNSKQPTP
jgi:hypothetical protein